MIILSVLLLAACGNTAQKEEKQASEKQGAEQVVDKEKVSDEQTNKQSENQNKNTQHKKVVKDRITYIDDILIVNKDIALPKDYAPGEQPEARQAVDSLMKAGNASGLHFAMRSGFRSYDTQTSLYNNYVARDGVAKADTYSARPGHSEHQSGLAFDLGNEAATDDFQESFENTPEGQWMKAHAHEYGFIIRYPKGKTNITGYQYEPWHIRYLGKEKAQKVHDSGLTLEEYLGLK